MAFSIQTNINSLIGQENLRINGNFQTQTISRLTSGYRINSSGDDAAGLAVANKYRSDTAELTQGVRNANDGISALQIVDGGLNNISTIIDRLRTLATQSSSSAFTGDRNTLNNEYQGLLSEITRQASNIKLNAGGTYNAQLTVYTGGGNSQSNSQVSVDLSGAQNQVDANGLGLSSSTVIGGGSNDISGAVTDLRSGTFLAAGTQTLTFQFGGSSQVVTVGNGATAITGAQALTQINAQIASQGLTAQIDPTNGALSFSGGSTPFTVSVAAPSAGTGIAATAAAGYNDALNRVQGQAVFTAVAGSAQTLAFTVNGNTTNVSLAVGTTLAGAQSQINT
ncbi:MAG: flagellin, partial [Acidobacteriota bacterium]|nr:flagellin [Acidobacteriota bacterium]